MHHFIFMDEIIESFSFPSFYFPDGTEETTSWLQEKMTNLSSLTPSSDLNLFPINEQICFKQIESIEQEILLKTKSLGIITKSLIIRKYILYIHLKEIMFTNLQNKIMRICSSNKNFNDINAEIEQFVKYITKLNNKFKEYSERIINQDDEFSTYCLGQYKQIRGWKNDMIVKFMFEHKGDEKEINDLSLMIKIPSFKITKLISSRKQQLISYIKSNESDRKRPAWLNPEISEKEIIDFVKKYYF